MQFRLRVSTDSHIFSKFFGRFWLLLARLARAGRAAGCGLRAFVVVIGARGEG